VSGSDDPRPRPLTRLLAVAAAPAAFCVAFLPAFYIGMIFEILAQTFAGGALGADGVPWLMGGALAGLAGFAGYAAVLKRPNQPVADEPPVIPGRDQLTHRQWCTAATDPT
jgi:hypothetical protein